MNFDFRLRVNNAFLPTVRTRRTESFRRPVRILEVGDRMSRWDNWETV